MIEQEIPIEVKHRNDWGKCLPVVHAVRPLSGTLLHSPMDPLCSVLGTALPKQGQLTESGREGPGNDC